MSPIPWVTLVVSLYMRVLPVGWMAEAEKRRDQTNEPTKHSRLRSELETGEGEGGGEEDGTAQAGRHACSVCTYESAPSDWPAQHTLRASRVRAVFALRKNLVSSIRGALSSVSVGSAEYFRT